jgi:hypothetical protein
MAAKRSSTTLSKVARRSLGVKDKPEWDVLRQHPGVQIECSYCRAWFDVDGVLLDEVHGWRCSGCGGGRPA